MDPSTFTFCRAAPDPFLLPKCQRVLEAGCGDWAHRADGLGLVSLGLILAGWVENIAVDA